MVSLRVTYFLRNFQPYFRHIWWHTYTRSRAMHIHMCKRANMYCSIHVHKRVLIHIRIYIYVSRYSFIYAYAYIHIPIHTCTCICTSKSSTHKHINARTHACTTHTYTYTFIHAYLSSIWGDITVMYSKLQQRWVFHAQFNNTCLQ